MIISYSLFCCLGLLLNHAKSPLAHVVRYRVPLRFIPYMLGNRASFTISLSLSIGLHFEPLFQDSRILIFTIGSSNSLRFRLGLRKNATTSCFFLNRVKGAGFLFTYPGYQGTRNPNNPCVLLGFRRSLVIVWLSSTFYYT